MSPHETYLTKEGLEKLKKELEYLKNTQRRELSQAVKKAREYGDISENAEYDAAKERLALNEAKARELEDKLSRARVIDDAKIPQDKAYIGAKVLLKDLDTEESIEYTLVSELEADFDQGKISIGSPVGKALLGKKEGEAVDIQVPAGTLKYKILKISR